MKNSNNPSAIRSRTLLTNALMELMKTKKYSTITITELVIKSDLTRKTFYRNFSGKDDILNAYIDELFQEYQCDLHLLANFTPYHAISTYFTFCLKHIDFLQLLQSQNLMNYILPKYETYLSFIASSFQKEIPNTTMETDYHIGFSTGGFWYILCLWLQNGAHQTPEEMATICCSFLVG